MRISDWSSDVCSSDLLCAREDGNKFVDEREGCVRGDRAVERTIERGRNVEPHRDTLRHDLHDACIFLDLAFRCTADIVQVVLLGDGQHKREVPRSRGERAFRIAQVRPEYLTVETRQALGYKIGSAVLREPACHSVSIAGVAVSL